jgi:hypothetical protein
MALGRMSIALQRFSLRGRILITNYGGDNQATVACDRDFAGRLHAFVNSSAGLLCSHGTDCPVARS